MKIIKCENGYVCEVSSMKIEKKAVLQLNFNIKSYQIIKTQGWERVQFPNEVLSSIKDKLTMSSEKVYEVINILDTFIETGDISIDNVSYNNRGFKYITTKDNENNNISIQQSSSAMEYKLWFGMEINPVEIGEQRDNEFIPYKYVSNKSPLLEDRLHLTINNAKNMRMAMLSEMALVWSAHDIADLIDRNTKTANDMIIDIWGDLKKEVQNVNFGYACSAGNVALVKKIYEHPENKFLENIIGTFEEYGMQSSMEPKSKKVLKFFKDVMKEKEIELSFYMKKWVQDNKLGRKIKIM